MREGAWARRGTALPGRAKRAAGMRALLTVHGSFCDARSRILGCFFSLSLGVHALLGEGDGS
jgi:hypothetical protein